MCCGYAMVTFCTLRGIIVGSMVVFAVRIILSTVTNKVLLFSVILNHHMCFILHITKVLLVPVLTV